jgi:hypothetical protein
MKIRRKWVVSILVAIAVIVVVGAGVGYWSFFGRVHQLPQYKAAMAKIIADAELRKALGEPITAAGWPPPSPRLEDREREVRWNILGPKGKAKARLLARMMGGKWETIVVEVTLADGKKILLADDSEGGAPPFVPPKPANGQEKPAEAAPPPDIDLQIPDAAPPAG